MASDNKSYVHPKTGNLVSAKGMILWNSVFKPRKGKGGKEGKHEINLLFGKDADHAATKEAATDAGKDKFSKAFKEAGGKWPSSIKTPFKRTKDNEKLVAALEANGMNVDDYPVFIGYRSSDKPGIVGPNGKSDGIDEDQVYAGRFARVTHDAYGYEFEGNKGVSFGLKNIQLLDNGDELALGGGRVSAETEFDAVEGAGDDSKSADSLFE